MGRKLATEKRRKVKDKKGTPPRHLKPSSLNQLHIIKKQNTKRIRENRDRNDRGNGEVRPRSRCFWTRRRSRKRNILQRGRICEALTGPTWGNSRTKSTKEREPQARCHRMKGWLSKCADLRCATRNFALGNRKAATKIEKKNARKRPLDV